MARTRRSTEYYDYIDTCYECKKCGASKYVKKVRTVVGWKSETSAGYGSDGKYHSAESDSREKKFYIARDGYYHREFDNPRGWCPACIWERRKKIAKITSITVAVILILSFAATAFSSFLNQNSNIYEWTYNMLLEKYENHAEFEANVETDVPGGQIAAEIAKRSAESDFYMHFYDAGSGWVQKYTDVKSVIYFYSFGDGCGELSGTVYIHMDGVLYVNGDEKVAYRKTAAEYDELLAKLEAYLPVNYCAQDTYTSEGRLASDADELYATIAYGEECTLLFDTGSGYYFEKTPEKFARIHFGEEDRTEKIPRISDYRVVERSLL